ncbi:MAG: hypothetical protein M9920_03175 [Verrucomicrobiae bacterium]|nr:hypothetical protein [Verrucomicrobiae bacterium]
MNKCSQTFSCRINVPRGTGLLKWFGACSSELVASREGLEVQNRHIEWTNIKRLLRHRGRVLISTQEGQSEFVVLSPLTGLQDPALASLIERLGLALSHNERENADHIFNKLGKFSKLVMFSKLASIFLVASAGIVAFIFPSFLLAFVMAAVVMALGVAWLPTLYANRV